jgi:histidinol-phosphate/aromatic aminotransferase/cobyric acid decarboxylase-like protein
MTLSSLDLERVTGGAGETAAVCTPDNPTGQSRPQQFFENNHAAPRAREAPPPSYGNFFTNPRDLPGKAQMLADRLRGR